MLLLYVHGGIQTFLKQLQRPFHGHFPWKYTTPIFQTPCRRDSKYNWNAYCTFFQKPHNTHGQFQSQLSGRRKRGYSPWFVDRSWFLFCILVLIFAFRYVLEILWGWFYEVGVGKQEEFEGVFGWEQTNPCPIDLIAQLDYVLNTGIPVLWFESNPRQAYAFHENDPAAGGEVKCITKKLWLI